MNQSIVEARIETWIKEELWFPLRNYVNDRGSADIEIDGKFVSFDYHVYGHCGTYVYFSDSEPSSEVHLNYEISDIMTYADDEETEIHFDDFEGSIDIE